MPFTWDDLSRVIDAEMKALGLPYEAHISEAPAGVAFALRLSRVDGSERPRITVPRRQDETIESFREALSRELQVYLQLCPLCGSEADVRRLEGTWLEVACPGCVNPYTIDEDLTRELRRAHTRRDQARLARMHRAAAAVRLSEERLTLHEASYQAIGRNGEDEN